MKTFTTVAGLGKIIPGVKKRVINLFKCNGIERIAVYLLKIEYYHQ